jgi:hypothetical protein
MNALTRKPRHRKSSLFGIRTALASAGAIVAGILIAVAGTTGSYALWNSAAPITDATVSSATLGITVKFGTGTAGSTAAIPTTAWSSLLPGDFVGQQITVANTGNIPATMSAKLTATTPYEIRVATGTCPSTLLTSTALSTSAVNYGTIAGGASAVTCVQVLLPITAAAGVQGTSSPFTITLTGAQ